MRVYLFLVLAILCSCNSRTRQESDNINGIRNSVEFKQEIWQSFIHIDSIYQKSSGYIFYSVVDGYVRHVNRTNSTNRKREVISDSLRLILVDKGLHDVDFKECLSKKYYSSLFQYREQLEDPITLGYLMTRDEQGKTLLSFLSRRSHLNYLYYDAEDFSDEMSEKDYINYHKARIHIVNDSLAIYKNLDAEISFEENLDIVYFILIKPGGSRKWVLDNIEIAKKEEEDAFDIRLIGESKPLEYFDYEEIGGY